MYTCGIGIVFSKAILPEKSRNVFGVMFHLSHPSETSNVLAWTWTWFCWDSYRINQELKSALMRLSITIFSVPSYFLAPNLNLRYSLTSFPKVSVSAPVYLDEVYTALGFFTNSKKLHAIELCFLATSDYIQIRSIWSTRIRS